MNKICIYGGLGNQMFQYALYTAFLKRGIGARISFVRYFYDYHHNGFDLWKAFQLPFHFPQQALSNIVTRMEPYYRNRLCEWLFRVIIPRMEIRGLLLYREKEEFEYDPLIFQQRKSLIEGVWQVESYFGDYRDELRRVFRFRLPQDPDNVALVEKIRSTFSVSIHIRRGDFYGQEYGKTHSVLSSLVYYRHAVACIMERVTNPEFFVFSDDIPWVKEHFPLRNVTYVDHNKGARSYLDMYLMSICKHNIIANSTFSWWGAWLNSNPDKIVTIPNIWLHGRKSTGIYPKGWIRLPVN
jgi:hypothetical protein